MLNRYADIKTLATTGVTELAREAGFTAATVRYYAGVGLLNPTRNPDNDYLCFPGADRRRVRFIRQAQVLGLTIGDINTVLEVADHGEVACDLVRSTAERRLQDVRQRLVDLTQTQARADEALASWTMTPSLALQTDELCPLIGRHRQHKRDHNRPVTATYALISITLSNDTTPIAPRTPDINFAAP